MAPWMKSIAEKGVVPDVSIDTDSSPGHELDMEDSQMRRLSILMGNPPVTMVFQSLC